MDIKLIFFIAIYMGIALCYGAKWSYTGKTGPKNWHELFPEACAGKVQSPIDLKAEQTVYDPNLKDFAIWYDPPKPDSKMIIENNGHTVQVNLEGEFYVSNGGLQNTFKAVQFHFHWGHTPLVGSEHLFEGVASPIEMHLVTFNHDRYENIEEAVVKPDGLAVLGVMFQLSEEDNPHFESIVMALKYIKDPERRSRVKLPLFSIRDLLPKDITRYYRYQGSLTTPGCFESVTWTVFHEMQTISKRQMAEFRKLLQFRRAHKKHNHHQHKMVERKRRSLTREEKKMEHNAEKVLDELGIKGNKLEEANLVNQVNKMDKPATSRADGSGDDRVGNSSNGMPKVVEGGAEEDNEANPTTTVPRYTQEAIGNNFRPVQALNGRQISRSFELRDIFYSEFQNEETFAVGSQDVGQVDTVETVQLQASKDDSGGSGGGAGDLRVSVSFTVALASLLSLVLAVL